MSSLSVSPIQKKGHLNTTSKEPNPNVDDSKESIEVAALTASPPTEVLETDYGNADYWNERYLRYSPFDWLITYEVFKAQELNSFMSHDDSILMLGCGSANFSADMYDDGYHLITNIDLSDVVIAQMKEANEKETKRNVRT